MLVCNHLLLAFRLPRCARAAPGLAANFPEQAARTCLYSSELGTDAADIGVTNLRGI